MKNPQVNVKKSKLRGNLFLLFWLVIFVFFASICVLSSVELHELEIAKAGIQAEISEYKQKYLELEASRNYFDSDAYVEKVAREQLGLVKPDETLYYNDAD